MDELIPLISQIQSTLTTIGLNHNQIDIPQIAVVGAQSVGKTSVIEALIGKDFLPKGSGIVTRRPLLLQLHNTKDPSDYGEFLHLPGKRFTKFEEIRNEIISETERSLGKTKNISPDIIVLKIYSPNMINLTLIDLPGIIKVPLEGQPRDIENQIRQLILSFISKENCLILAITAANTDLANSDSLKIARDVDPLGNRTIGVITKCDSLEDGSDVSNILLGNVYPLKLGYIGVMCRSTTKINQKKTIQEALKDEENLFSMHPHFNLVKNRCGISFLRKTLNKTLATHIFQSIPNLKANLSNFLFNTEKELSSYEDPILPDDSLGPILLNFLSRFSHYFEDAIEGKIPFNSTDTLSGGSRINAIFHDWYYNILSNFQPMSDLTDLEIRTTIRNASGPKSSLFIPDEAFELLIKKQIVKLEDPSLKCAEHVFKELNGFVEQCDLPEMKRFSRLKEEIYTVVQDTLSRLVEPTYKMIRDLIQMQTAYINTKHPEFLETKRRLSGKLPESNFSDSAPSMHKSSLSSSIPIKDNPSFIINPIEKLESFIDQAKPYGNKLLYYLMKERHNSDISTLLQFPDNNASNSVFKPNFKNDFSSAKLTQYYQNPEQSTNIILPSIPDKIVPTEPPSHHEALECFFTKELLNTYFRIVRQSISDSVPKAIMYFMVNRATEIIHRQLVTTLYKEALFKDLLMEDKKIADKRKELLNLKRNLIKALETFEEFPKI